MKALKIIGVASGWGAKDPRCEDGPLVIRQSNVLDTYFGRELEWIDILKPAPKLVTPIEIIADLSARLAHYTETLTKTHQPFAVLGGDHSIAIGTWSGACAGLDGETLGLIWVDAHMDSHTPQTSPSGAVHGMPLAVLLGYGDPTLTLIATNQPKLLAQNVCLVGVRSYERGEEALLERLGVRIFGMQEIQTRGLAQVIRDAINIATTGTAAFGVTIDLDGIDPCDAPGIGSPAPDGLVATELLAALTQVHGHPRLLGVEIAEYNPARDISQRTAKLAAKLLHVMLKPKDGVDEK